MPFKHPQSSTLDKPHFSSNLFNVSDYFDGDEEDDDDDYNNVVNRDDDDGE